MCGQGTNIPGVGRANKGDPVSRRTVKGFREGPSVIWQVMITELPDAVRGISVISRLYPVSHVSKCNK